MAPRITAGGAEAGSGGLSTGATIAIIMVCLGLLLCGVAFAYLLEQGQGKVIVRETGLVDEFGEPAKLNEKTVFGVYGVMNKGKTAPRPHY